MPSTPRSASLSPGPLEGVTFVAATPLEVKALRRALPGVRIVHAGVGLARALELGDAVISFGLAGGLRDDLSTGTILIPRSVRRPDGTMMSCDSALVDALAHGARSLGIEPCFDPLLTSETIVNGAERARWAALGFGGADMETGLIRAARVAAVRVVLDTPSNELSSDWQRPLAALLRPRNWPQARWLARQAPLAASRAGAVVAATQGIGAEIRITRQ